MRQLLSSLTIACASGSLVLAAAGAAESKPNIVFILADDLGWGELGCYGQQKIRTPNIDRLAAEGIRFTQHYSGAPTCAPSRGVLMTGLHLGHAEIRGNRETGEEGQWPLSAKALTIAQVLKTAGYSTGAVGKWGLGFVGTTGDPNKKGFDLFYGYNCQREAHSYFPDHLWSNNTRVLVNKSPVPGQARQEEGAVKLEDWLGETYAPDLIVKQAVKFVDDHAQQPFFLYCAFTEPHVALHPPKRLVDSYPAEWDPVPYRGESGYLPHPRPHAAYAALITSLDEHVGEILNALELHKLSDNTIVIFTSDNGTTLTRPGAKFAAGGVDPAFFNSTHGLRGFKGSVYEGGLRVPLIARWPGKIKSGSTSDFPSYFPDHFATLCDLIGSHPEGRRDGVSLKPVFLGMDQPERNPMVWVYAEYGQQVAVRVGDYKILRQQLAKGSGKWEVYNIKTDPGESKNLSSDKPELIQKAKAILAQQTSPNPEFPVKLPNN